MKPTKGGKLAMAATILAGILVAFIEGCSPPVAEARSHQEIVADHRAKVEQMYENKRRRENRSSDIYHSTTIIIIVQPETEHREIIHEP